MTTSNTPLTDDAFKQCSSLQDIYGCQPLLHLARNLERELTAARAEVEALLNAYTEFRDTVLHERGALAENGMSSDQINDVLSELDAAIDAARQKKEISNV